MGPQRMYGLTPWVRRLLVANLLVFLIQSTLLTSPSFVGAFGFSPAHAWQYPWTFITYMFLHAGIPHILFNMLMLFVFGSSVEDRMGGRMFVLFYLKGQDWWLTRDARRGPGGPLSESSVLVSQPPRISRGGSLPPSARRGKSRGGNEPDARANAEIDRVLDKIIASGVESLTPAERKFLTEISRRLRTPPPKS